MGWWRHIRGGGGRQRDMSGGGCMGLGSEGGRVECDER